MCGIIGILGKHEVSPQLVDALRRLEYRGYDSAGVATVDAGGRLDRRRAVGKLINLSDRLVHEPLRGHAGIGHTRWATHGAATEANAHPHRHGPVAVVHNGIIENFRDLRDELIAAGIQPQSQTDTETVALMTGRHMEQGLSPVEAARATLARLRGAFALAFLFQGETDLMVVARKGSPLAIGHGADEMFVGSDAVALAPFTDRITYLEDGDHAVLTRAGAQVFGGDGSPVARRETRIDVGATAIDKGGYRHFMAKEIAEQPVVIGDVLNHYVKGDRIVLPDGLDFAGVDRIALTGMSLGGYTSALIASVDDRIQAVIPNVPVVTPDRTVDEWFPANKVVALRDRLAGTDSALVDAATMYSSPLNYRPIPAKDRRLIIAGLGDRLAPPEQAEMLWKHWDHCAFHWFPGNHVLHVSQPDYLRRMTRFLGEFMFD